MRMQRAYLSVLLSLIAVAALLLLFAPRQNDAQAIVDSCAKEADKASCYEKEIPALYPGHSVEYLFDVVREVRTLDPSYQFCHVLAHKIGEQIVAEDPAAWVDAIPFNPPDGMCSNGFIHGVVGGRFRSEVLDDKTIESLIPDFRRACEARPNWRPSDLDRAICYHGMGHLFLFITDGDIKKALGICERVTDENHRRVCVQGVFMQIYQPLEPDDFALIERLDVKPTKENVRQLCASYSAKPLYEGSCLQESWPLFREDIIKGTGVEEYCKGYPTSEEETQCYVSASAIIGRMSLGRQEQAIAACNAFPAARRSVCFINVAQAALEEDRNDAKDAISLCANSGAGTDECLRALVSRATFIFGEDAAAREAFCAALPTDQRGDCERLQ